MNFPYMHFIKGNSYLNPQFQHYVVAVASALLRNSHFSTTSLVILTPGKMLISALSVKIYLLILETERKGEREREKHRFVLPLMYASIGCFLYFKQG